MVCRRLPDKKGLLGDYGLLKQKICARFNEYYVAESYAQTYTGHRVRFVRAPAFIAAVWKVVGPTSTADRAVFWDLILGL